jgi:UDP-2,4-diacetamido-2,4,6-trideoxy-beta-L-altropyranose hydrolase
VVGCHIAFRTDATSEIGTGHFMRCLALADALKERGAHLRFVSHNLPAYLRDMLVARGIDLVALCNETTEPADDLAHSRWLGTSQKNDAQATIKALTDQQWDWIIVDHYALDARWERALRVSTKRLMVIDDIADRYHDCDMLLDQNLYTDMQERYAGKVPPQCRLLLGPKYALLRPEFRETRKRVSQRTGVAKRILVFFGGMDTDNYTVRAIEALVELGLGALQVDVVVGMHHPCLEEIQALCKSHEYHCHVQTKRMAELMESADLAIGAGGSACWERCCLGLPAVLVALAENQIDIAKMLDSVSASIYIGTIETADSSAIQRSVSFFLRDSTQLKLFSQQAFSLVDGMGIDRVIRELGG